MSTLPVLVAALVVLSAAGLVAWSWLVMAEVEKQLLTISGFKGMHFDI